MHKIKSLEEFGNFSRLLKKDEELFEKFLDV